MALFQRPGWIDDLDDLVVRLVGLRSRFPETGQQSWDWTQLAKRQLDRQPFELFNSLLSLIDAGALQIFGPSEDQELLEGAFRASGAPGWDLVTSMLEAGSWRIQMNVRGWITEPFSSSNLAGLKYVDGFGELPGAPGAAAEFPQDAPRFELSVGSFSRAA
jgi:hypothetical protein